MIKQTGTTQAVESCVMIAGFGLQDESLMAAPVTGVHQLAVISPKKVMSQKVEWPYATEFSGCTYWGLR